MILDYLYFLFEECDRELKEVGSSEEERYYALAKALLNLYTYKEKYEVEIKAYEALSERVKGSVLVFESGIGVLPYAILKRGKVSKLKARSLRKEQEELLNKVFSKMGLPQPFLEPEKKEKFDFIIFSKYLSGIGDVEGKLEESSRFLEEGGRIIVLDLGRSGVFDEAEEWALRNGMRGETLFKEKFKLPFRGGSDYYMAVEYHFIEAKRSRYIKTGIFLMKP